MVGTRRGSGHSDPPRSEEHPPGPDEGLDCHHPTPGRRPPARPPDLWSIASRAQNSPVLIMIGKTCEGIALSEPVSRESLDRRPVLVPWIIRITPSTIGLDSTRRSRSRSRPRLEVPRPNHGLTTRGHLNVTPLDEFRGRRTPTCILRYPNQRSKAWRECNFRCATPWRIPTCARSSRNCLCSSNRNCRDT